MLRKRVVIGTLVIAAACVAATLGYRDLSQFNAGLAPPAAGSRSSSR